MGVNRGRFSGGIGVGVARCSDDGLEMVIAVRGDALLNMSEVRERLLSGNGDDGATAPLGTCSLPVTSESG
jgi:hypothetical protein